MRKFILVCATLFAVVVLISASPAQAQFALWVSPTGNDSNNCFEATPCLTFQGAINKGNVGQINCIGSGSYGTFTITASITVDCGAGNVGNIINSGVSGITINTSAPATIVLRHLALNGLGNNGNVHGINASSFPSGTLIVEDCMMQGYHGGVGILFGPQSGRGLLQVSNSQMFDNADGIIVRPGSGQIASVTLNKVELVASLDDGLLFQGSGVVAGTMRDSVVGQNENDGVLAEASQVFFTIEESSIVDNLANGIDTESPGSAIKVAASTIGGNGTGILANAGSIVSFGDNHVSDNGVNGIFSSTKALQ